MKILIYNVMENKKQKLFEKEALEKEGHEVVNYTGDEQEKFCLSNHHFQMYQTLLSEAEKENVDIIFFETMICPEFLLAELSVRKNYKPRIVFTATFRGIFRSKARAHVFKELIKNKYVKKAVFHSMVPEEFIEIPQNWKELEIPIKKIQFSTPPRSDAMRLDNKYDGKKYNTVESREFFKLPKSKFIVTFFGRNSFVKGLDLLEEASLLVPDDIHFFVHVSEISDVGLKTKKGLNNITYLHKYLLDEDINRLLSVTDVFAQPYRKPYMFGGSGTPIIASYAKKPVILPMFYPFDTVINKYKIGVGFEAENIKSLAEAVVGMKENYEKIKSEAMFEEYFNIFLSDKEVASLIAK